MRSLKAVTEAGFDPASIVCSEGDTKKWRVENAADRCDVGVVEQVGGADIGRESLLVLSLGVTRDLEGALQVGIEVGAPGPDAAIAT